MLEYIGQIPNRKSKQKQQRQPRRRQIRKRLFKKTLQVRDVSSTATPPRRVWRRKKIKLKQGYTRDINKFRLVTTNHDLQETEDNRHMEENE